VTDSVKPETRLAASAARARIMLVTPARIAYRGLFGKPGVRTMGAWLIYVALDQPFQISRDGGEPTREHLALVPPYQPHQVATADREIAQILLEAETVEGADAVEPLFATRAQRTAMRARILAAFDQPLGAADAFDRHFFGAEIAARALDSRIAAAVTRIVACQGANVTAQACAARAGLSFSRFTHLFSTETQTTFRRFRAWKRARSLMSMVGGEPSLVHVALDAGYADSTHFSHAIRQFYGYTPRDIFAGSRRLCVVSRWPSGNAAA
jgi:AraC-like DNA-binding protein